MYFLRYSKSLEEYVTYKTKRDPAQGEEAAATIERFFKGGYETGGAYVAQGGAELLIETANKRLESL